MVESEFQLEYATQSVSLAEAARSVLRSVSRIPSKTATEIEDVADQVGRLLESTPEAAVPKQWIVLQAGLRLLASRLRCVDIAHSGDGDLIVERARSDVLMQELQRCTANGSEDALADVAAVSDLVLGPLSDDSNRLRGALGRLPSPTIYWRAKPRPESFLNTGNDSKPDHPPTPLVRLITDLDHAPLATPQLLRANLLYPVLFRVRGLTWPSEANRLCLDLLTTCPATEYKVSSFAIDRPVHIVDNEYEAEVSGYIKFSSGQSSLFDDLVFAVRAAFENQDGQFREVSVIGHGELRFRIVDDQRHPLMTGNRRLDRHIEGLATEVLRSSPSVRDELGDLLPVLQALTRLLATYAQEAIYKGRSDVVESEFQATVLRDLRNQLGQDVQEHPKQGGGVSDIRVRGVIIELKVERENGNRRRICDKYSPQTTQYAGVEARQVSVLLVLDLTSKECPPGDIRNDILLSPVKTHGTDETPNEFPSFTVVFVVNGNMQSPSFYSQ